MKTLRFDFAVFAAMVLASIALGVLNNLRVDEEKRVPLAGYPEQEQEEEDADS